MLGGPSTDLRLCDAMMWDFSCLSALLQLTSSAHMEELYCRSASKLTMYPATYAPGMPESAHLDTSETILITPHKCCVDTRSLELVLRNF